MSEEIDSQAAAPDEDRLRRMLDAALLLNSTLELKELTEIILEIVREQVPVDRVSVFVVDRESNFVRSLVAQKVQREIALPIGSGIAGTVAATGEIIDIPDAYADPRFDSSFDAALGYRTHDLLAMPIVNRTGRVCGVLQLLNRMRSITEADMEYLRAMSIYVGLAVENAWLYQLALDSELMKRDLIRLRDRLAGAERLAVISQMLHNVAHEINNPLAVAMGNAGLLSLRVESDPQCLKYAQTIESAIERASRAVRKYINIVEAESHDYQATEVGKLLRQTVALREWEWELLGIEATIDIGDAPLVHGNQEQLQLIFLHLLIHAEQAALQGASPRRIMVRLRHDTVEQRVTIEVEDSGPGVPRSHDRQPLENLLNNTGAGATLGLATVRTIAERHQGRLWYDTPLEAGTIFVVELPALASTTAN